MSEDILNMFKERLNQAEAIQTNIAVKAKCLHKGIPLNCLLCGCNRRLREKLERIMNVASQLSVDRVMELCFKGHQLSQDAITYIRNDAKVKKEHTFRIFLQELVKSLPNFTIENFIQALESAHLYRTISVFEGKVLNCSCSKTTNSQTGLQHFRVQDPLPPTSSRKQESRDCRGIVLLTYTKDGSQLATEVRRALEKPSDKNGRYFTVVNLSDFTGYLQSDHLHNLRWIMERVDFIVPILTDGFLRMVYEREEIADYDSLDERFSPLVAKLIINQWDNANFKNEKVRCFKAREVKYSPKFPYGPFQIYERDLQKLPIWLKRAKR